MFSDIIKHDHEHQICLRCFKNFRTKESYARHKQLCTQNDFMSMLHVLFTPGSKQAQIKFYLYKYFTKAPFVTYADVESILEPFKRQVKYTTYKQQHKVCEAAAIFASSCYNFYKRTVMIVEKNALAEFLDTLIV